MRLLKSPRVIAAAAVVAVILAMAAWPSATEIDVGSVQRGPMQVTIDEEGETRVRERFVVSAPVTGRVERIELEPGTRVVRGKTTVARLIPAAAPLIDTRTQSELNAAVAAAGASVGQAQADSARAATALTRAQSNLRRVTALAAAGALSEDALEAAQVALRSAEAEARAAGFTVARAEHELQLARARLRPSSAGGRAVDVVAPVDGVVLKRLRESAAVVPVGEPLLEIGDPESLEVVSDLLSTDAVRVAPGDEVSIEQWGGDHPLTGRVRLVEPSGFMKVSALGVEEQRVNVVIDLGDMTARRRLGDGYRVEVRIVTWRDAAALKVPVGSIFRRGDEWAVFTVAGGRARRQVVKLGERNDREAQVLEGLSEGRTVIVHPPDTLADGGRVKPRAVSP